MTHQQIAKLVEPAAWSGAAGITNHTQDREEAVAHALRTIIDKFDEWDGRPIGAWANRIARNKAIDLKKKRRNDCDYEATEFMHVPSEQPLDEVDYSRLRAAIDSLSPKKRELTILHYYKGMEMQTIAESVGTSLSNVKVTIMRARRDLKQLLSQ